MTSQPELPSKKETPAGARIPAFILALLLVTALPLSLLAYDVWRVVYNPDLVKEILTDEVLNSDLIPIALEWFSEVRADERVASGEALTGVDEPDIVLLLSFMDRDDWRGIKEEVLTDEFLTDLVSVSVDGVYSWIDSDDRVPQITWDLRSFIERVNGDHGEAAIVIAYDKLPECTDEQVNDFVARQAAAPPNTEVLYNLCEFPDPWHDDQFSDYVNALFKVVENIPPDFALTGEVAQADNPEGVGPEALKQQLRLIRTAARWAWLLPLGLVILIGILAVRSLRSLGRWEGRPLLWGGLLTLVVALLLRVSISGILSAGLLSEVPQVVMTEVVRIAGRLLNAIFTPMMIQAAVILVLGLFLTIAGARAKPKPAGE